MLPKKLFVVVYFFTFRLLQNVRAKVYCISMRLTGRIKAFIRDENVISVILSNSDFCHKLYYVFGDICLQRLFCAALAV